MTSPYITDVTEKNFIQEVLQSDKLVLIEFSSDHCAPCRALLPTLEKFAEENQDKVKVVKINIEEAPALTMKFEVQSIPLLITMKDAQVLFGMVGAVSKSELEKLVSASLSTPAAPVLTPPKPPVP